MIPVLLLLALPASGKSEIRRYLEHPDPSLPSLPVGPTIQLDDYPYVHIMRRISQEQLDAGIAPTFFDSVDSSFTDPRDWLTLIHLLNEDFASLGTPERPSPQPEDLFDRIDAARCRAGISGGSVPRQRERVARALAGDAAELAESLPVVTGETLTRSTVVIEFARGGPTGAAAPLPHPIGYRASLAALSAAILTRAAILYVWVSPEESRRRNRERAVAGPEGDATILHHGVPEQVLRADYGMDDIEWLEKTSPQPGAILVKADAATIAVPVQRFDNRVDRTSFLRDDPAEWALDRIRSLHAELARALERLDGTRPSSD
ncbi:MAG: hypothetical protein A2Z12_05365 [Actinobacteria bacterium RBG_16_68_21]|nr:MAG: hypothetical protein A2Z12_05365 [Actinobacteria bacterium RBG_16_68_21]